MLYDRVKAHIRIYICYKETDCVKLEVNLIQLQTVTTAK